MVADGYHLLSDVISSIGVTFGVLLAIETGWTIVDPALAGLVAVNILWSGWKAVKEALSGLLDEAVPGRPEQGLASPIGVVIFASCWRSSEP